MNTEINYNGIFIPFPVEVPFAMRPNLRAWQQNESILTTDKLFADYIQQKKILYNIAYGDNPDVSLLRSAIKILRGYDSSFSLNENLDGPAYNLTMSLQEDWVLFAPNKKEQLSAQILSVLFPSGWDPREKAGKTFLEIHEPVPDFDLVNKASEYIAKTITTKGPFIRHVWTISDSEVLSRKPGTVKEKEIDRIDQLWYRCERQITVPIDSRACLFLIRLYVMPLADVFKDTEKKKKIKDSINSMSDNTLEYKNLIRIKNLINQHA